MAKHVGGKSSAPNRRIGLLGLTFTNLEEVCYATWNVICGRALIGVAESLPKEYPPP